MSNFIVKITPSANKDASKALKKNPAKKHKVNKAIGRMKTHGPNYPSFRTHKMQSSDEPPTFISYIENHTPSAWRIYWPYWGEEIHITYIGPHE